MTNNIPRRLQVLSLAASVSRVTWRRGESSLYFRDPDNHMLELLTPGVWAN